MTLFKLTSAFLQVFSAFSVVFYSAAQPAHYLQEGMVLFLSPSTHSSSSAVQINKFPTLVVVDSQGETKLQRIIIKYLIGNCLGRFRSCGVGLGKASIMIDYHQYIFISPLHLSKYRKSMDTNSKGWDVTTEVRGALVSLQGFFCLRQARLWDT